MHQYAYYSKKERFKRAVNGFFASFAGFLTIIAIALAALFYGGDRYMSYVCGNFGELSGKEVKYVAFDTCYVKVDNSFIRYSEYEARATAQNLKGD